MAACGRCGAPTPPGARFCPACGASVAETSESTSALKTVTILFTDLIDSTALGERFDPEALHGVMREYFDTVRSIVETHGGSVEKFIGDAVMAVFGIPTLHEDDALRAVAAAAAIHRAIAELSARLEREASVSLQVHTGVNTGRVLSQASDGATGRLVGDAVNVASRLQDAAAPGEILIGPETYQLVGGIVLSESLEPLVVKGRNAPVAAHRLVDVFPRREARARPGTPIVGRERELRLLRNTLDRVVQDRTPHLFTVLGPPGVGKSRLVSELAGERGILFLDGRCLPYGEGITYWPLAEIVQKASAIESRDDPETARAKLAESAGDDEDAAVVAQRVAQVVGLAEAGGTTEDHFWAVRKYLEGLARRRPVVAVFDDVHWAEPTLLDLLDDLVDSIRDVPLLVVCMARLELFESRPTWGGGKMNASSLVLGPLKEDECRVLLESLLGASPVVAEVTEAVFRVADGNPLFVEEMVSMLVEHGLLQKVEGRWTAARDLTSVTVPPTIQALVAARLDRLSPEEREVVGTAAVMGKVFSPRALSELAPAPVGERVDDALEALTRKQLVEPGEVEFAGGKTYAFRHLLIRDTAYEHLPRATRAAIHERFADWLVDVLGDRVAEYDEVVGYHLEQAYLYQTQLELAESSDDSLAGRAADRLAEAGGRALARQDAAAAVKLLSRAAELLGHDDRNRLQVLMQLGRSLDETGRYADAMEVFDEAIALGRELGDERVATTSLIFKERARIHREPKVNAENVRAVAEEAVEILMRLDDDYGLCHAWDLAAYVHDCAGRADEALAALKRAEEHAVRSGVASMIAYQKRALLSSLAWGAGNVADVIDLAQELLESARTNGDRYSEVRALLTLAEAEAMMGRFHDARDHVALQKRICDEVSLESIHAYGAFERAHVEALAGDIAAAAAEAAAGCTILNRLGEKGVLPTLQVQHADFLYELGQVDAAKRVVDTARDLSADDDSLTEMKWRSVTAKIAAMQGRRRDALALADRAAAIADTTSYLDWKAGVFVDIADALTLVGFEDRAVEALRKAAALYEEKGNEVALRSLDRRLDSKTPS